MTDPTVQDAQADRVPFKIADGEGFKLFGSFPIQSCGPVLDARELLLKVRTLGQISTWNIRVDLREAPSLVEVIPEGAGEGGLAFHSSAAAFIEASDNACAHFNDQRYDPIEADPNLGKDLLSWLERAAPDCQWSMPSYSEEWVCSPKVSSEDFSYSLGQVRSAMRAGWNRFPYIFTRRLNLLEKLYEAHVTEDDIHRSTVCRLLEQSSEEEMPFIMRGKGWSRRYCDEAVQEARDKENPFVGEGMRQEKELLVRGTLEFGLDELRFLMQLAKRLNHPGLLSLKLPSIYLPSEDVLVSLTPNEEARKTLLDSVEKVLAENTDEEKSAIRGACWHPFFENPERLYFAQKLGLSGERLCVASDEKLATDLAEYFFDSLISESQFVISNGKTKSLNLPIGIYQYALVGVNKSRRFAVEGYETDVKSFGELHWTGSKAPHTIREWKQLTH